MAICVRVILVRPDKKLRKIWSGVIKYRGSPQSGIPGPHSPGRSGTLDPYSTGRMGTPIPILTV